MTPVRRGGMMLTATMAAYHNWQMERAQTAYSEDSTPSAATAGVAQLVEAADSSSALCGFDARRRHQLAAARLRAHHPYPAC